MAKTVGAAVDMNKDKIVLAGGVASNSRLREMLQTECKKHGIALYYPDPILCTDNAAMIGCAAYYKYKDYVFPFFEIAQGKIVSITVSMSNESGMLSSVLKAIADKNGSILTINQDIPLQGIANSSISFETKNLQGSLEELLHDIRNMKGIIKVEILGQA